MEIVDEPISHAPIPTEKSPSQIEFKVQQNLDSKLNDNRRIILSSEKHSNNDSIFNTHKKNQPSYLHMNQLINKSTEPSDFCYTKDPIDSTEGYNHPIKETLKQHGMTDGTFENIKIDNILRNEAQALVNLIHAQNLLQNKKGG